eukprot:TRINITY_DN135_c2_g1_i1.p1 TRINITY_DN135_c2_g1~~TRINITY_DN135_c2_g1_i1.p1  ORF type:complete len:579 (+),score=300.93 TRINITY_DN135_c2_g1_i1:90-1826(+)
MAEVKSEGDLNGKLVDDSKNVNGNSKKNRNKNKKKRQKERKKKEELLKEEKKLENEKKSSKNDEVIVEYVEENLLEQLDPNDPSSQEFAKILERFNASRTEAEEEERLRLEEEKKKEEEEKKSNESEEEGEGEDGEKTKNGPSKREKKKQGRISVAVLKQLVERPDVVESWDITSSDPKLLISLKSYRNAVPIPQHWSQKRKYLQGKRGIEKAPFALPDFIANTGISKIRSALDDDDDGKKLKTKQREKTAPKLGKMSIAYDVLQDAFYRYQTKPKLTVHGDLYYEGKEFEITLKEKKPGNLSEELRKALGMPDGAPPPWLFAMQRVGPPPSYPNLKIPGLNHPIPEGARYGTHPGGWGIPPVDQYGRPLYGDPFGNSLPDDSEVTAPIEKKHWGELEEAAEEEYQQEEAVEEGEEEEEDTTGTETPSGLITPSGVETPEVVQLRRQTSRQEEEEDDSNKQLYHVIQQQEVSIGSAAFGSSHRYVVPSEAQRVPKGKNAVGLIKSQASEKMDVALEPHEVESLESGIDPSQLFNRKYDQARADKQGAPREELTDIMREELKKRKKKDEKDDKGKKFKF